MTAACLLTACGGDERTDVTLEVNTPAAPGREAPEEVTAGDPETRVDPKTRFVADVDVAAFRVANGLPPDGDVAQEKQYREPVSTGLAYLPSGTLSPLEKAIDNRRITRAIFDGDATIVATTQPFAEIDKAARAAGATDEDGVLVLDRLAVGEAGAGLIAVGFDVDAVRKVQGRQGGEIPPRLEPILERAGDQPIRVAKDDPKGACLKSIAIAGGEGDRATAIIEVDGKASAARSRLGRPVGGQGSFAFQTPKAEGPLLTVPFTQYDANLAFFIGERVYSC